MITKRVLLNVFSCTALGISGKQIVLHRLHIGGQVRTTNSHCIHIQRTSKDTAPGLHADVEKTPLASRSEKKLKLFPADLGHTGPTNSGWSWSLSSFRRPPHPWGGKYNARRTQIEKENRRRLAIH
eukprot:6364281-Amphidinium_carterae.2